MQHPTGVSQTLTHRDLGFNMADIFDFERAAYHSSMDRLDKRMEELQSQVNELRDLLEDAGFAFTGAESCDQEGTLPEDLTLDD